MKTEPNRESETPFEKFRQFTNQSHDLLKLSTDRIGIGNILPQPGLLPTEKENRPPPLENPRAGICRNKKAASPALGDPPSEIRAISG